ncbi:permease-like cell division protein FtsX [Bacillaceae bacterium W0354]
MKFNTAKRHFKEGTKNILRNSWMSVASIGAVTTTLILVGVFLALVLNINHFAENIENEVQLNVYIDLLADEAEIAELGEKIEAIPEVVSVQFSSKDEELDKLIESLGEGGELWELFEQSNPLNDAYIVKTKEATQYKGVAAKVSQMDSVDEVNYREDTVDSLLVFNHYARIIGLIFVGALLLTAMFLISNTIRMTIIARQDEIGIMKLVGAKNSFIRGPFFVEGLLLGVFGSILPITFVVVGYYFLSTKVNLKIPFFEWLPFHPFAWQLSLLLLGIGAVIGIWGSIMSVRKFLRV